MDPLAEYRAVQHARYLERERQREAAEAAATAVVEAEALALREAAERANNAWLDIHTRIAEIKQYTVIFQVNEAVKNLHDVLQRFVEDGVLERRSDTLAQLGMELLDAINNNAHIKTDFSNQIQVRLSHTVRENVQKILAMCNVITQEEDLDVNYEMDTSRDEELARQLADELPPAPAPAPARRRGRPRRNPVE